MQARARDRSAMGNGASPKEGTIVVVVHLSKHCGVVYRITMTSHHMLFFSSAQKVNDCQK